MIFQDPMSCLDPLQKIGDHIVETITTHGQGINRTEAWKRAGEMLDRLGIDPSRLEDYPHQLSGGMNQRAFLAMALACKPELLIADEPTTSLDVTIEAEILRLLLDLKQNMGFSLLFITHNLSIAKRIADRICVMYKGKIVEEGSVDKIFNQPGHFHTRQLISAYEKIGKI